jgi:uncharacterized phage protein (predicted DNA packaging)
MIVSLDEAKLYLRLDDDYSDEDVLIQSLELAAEESLFNSTGIIFDDTSNLAKLYINVMINDFYSNRSIIEPLKTKTRDTLTNIALQLQYAYTMPILTLTPAGSYD